MSAWNRERTIATPNEAVIAVDGSALTLPLTEPSARRPTPSRVAELRPRRITLATSATAWGGAELQATALARTLVARGHRVTLLEFGGRWFDRSEVHAVPGLRVVHDAGPRLRELAARDALRALRPHAGDVCVVSKPSFGERALGMDVAARLLFRRYVRWEHHPAPPAAARPAVRFAGRRPSLGLWWHHHRLQTSLHTRAAHRVITVSDTVRDRLATLPGYDARRTVRVHCGIDVAAFEPTTERRARARASFAIPPDAVVLGAIGRLAENKRYDRALRAFRDLVTARPRQPLYFLLGGTGPEAPRLRELARELGVAERTLFPGVVPHASDVLLALDLFVMPSELEGLGIALLEAMACGCACIATDAGGPAEILRDPALGWLVPGDDADAFGAALAQALDEPAAARAQRAARARAHVAQHFSAERQLELLAHAVERA